MFNLLDTTNGGSDGAPNISGSFDGSGLILGLDSNITDFAPSGEWTGRLFSGATIHLFSGGAIEQPVVTPPVPTQVPEPSTLAILGAALAAMAAITSLRRRTWRPIAGP